jgi:hypothetical protein
MPSTKEYSIGFRELREKGGEATTPGVETSTQARTCTARERGRGDSDR